MHAEAGDTLQIWLRNLLTVTINLEPMGSSWNIQGMLKPVEPGLTASFSIDVPLQGGPPAGAVQSSSLYLYRNTLNPTFYENAGLVGPIVVTRKGDANSDGTPKGVDREIVTVFQVMGLCLTSPGLRVS